MKLFTRQIVVFCIFSINLSATGNPSVDLWQAARNGQLKQCKNALKQGADVNYTADDGSSALWQASLRGHEKVVAFLLDREADPLRSPLPPEEPDLVAATRKSKLSPRALFNKLHLSSSGGAVPTRKKIPAPRGGSEIVQSGQFAEAKELNSRLNMAAVSKKGERKTPYDLGAPVHAAILRGHKNVVMALMRVKGPQQIAITDLNGNTPIHLAAIAGELDIFEGLMEALDENNKELFEAQLRLAINTANKEGLMPIHLATIYGKENSVWMVEHLLSHGADVNAHTLDMGLTAFELAQRKVQGAGSDKKAYIAYSYLLLFLTLKGADITHDSHSALKLISAMIRDQRVAIAHVVQPSPDSDVYGERNDPLEFALKKLILGDITLRLPDVDENKEGYEKELDRKPLHKPKVTFSADKHGDFKLTKN